MEIYVDRSLPITIIEQIKGKLTYDIMCGKLGPGTVLPSVRELSARLEVAPMTIARVYRDLASDKLIAARPGIGTFVADLTELGGRRTPGAGHNLQQLAAAFLRQSMVLGYTPQEVCESLQHQVECRETECRGPRVALVGNFRRATAAYGAEIEAVLEDLNVRVQVILMSELGSDLDACLGRIKGIRLVITIPSRMHEVRHALGPLGYDVVAVAFRVSPDTRRQVAAIRPETRVGVIATYPEFLTSLLEGVLSYGIPEQQPLTAFVDQEDRVREILGQVDVVVHASGSERILRWLPNGVEAIEYRHVPDPASLNRLRPLLDDRAVQWADLAP